MLIGNASTKALDFLDVARSPEGIFEISGEILGKTDKITGKYRIVAQLNILQEDEIDEEYNSTRRNGGSMVGKKSTTERDEIDGSLTNMNNMLEGSSSTFNTSRLTDSRSQHSATLLPPIQIKFPMKVEVIAIHAYELRPVQFFGKNNPSISLECGSHRFQTEMKPNSGEIAEWYNINCKFVMNEKNYIKICLHNKKSLIATTVIKSVDIISLPQDYSKLCELVQSLWKDSVYFGSVKLLLKISSKSDDSPVSSNNPSDNEDDDDDDNDNNDDGSQEDNGEGVDDDDKSILSKIRSRSQSRSRSKQQSKKSSSQTLTTSSSRGLNEASLKKAGLKKNNKQVSKKNLKSNSYNGYNDNDDDNDDNMSDKSDTTDASSFGFGPPPVNSLRSLIDDVAQDTMGNAIVNITSIRIHDMDSSILKSNSKYNVTVVCGPRSNSSPECKGKNLPAWENLSFSYSIVRDIRIRIGLFSGSKRIGSTTFNFNELRLASQNSLNIADLYGILTNEDNNIIGKLQMICTFIIDNKKAPEVRNNMQTNENSSSPAYFKGSYLDSSIVIESSNLADVGDFGGSSVDVGNGVPSSPLAINSSVAFNNNTITTSVDKYYFDTSGQKLNLPIRVFICDLTCSNLQSVHKFASNSPFVVIKCGQETRTTSVLKKTGSSAAWESLDFSFILVNFKSSLELEVMSGKNLIGATSISAKELIEYPQDFNGLVDIPLKIYSNKKITGDLNFTSSFLPLTVQEKKDLEESSSLIDPSSSKTDQDQNQNDQTDVDNNKNQNSPHLNLSITKKSPYNLADDETMISYESLKAGEDVTIRLRFVNFAAADLRPVHTLGPNSPYFRIVYGDQAFNTEVHPRAGASSRWANQNFLININNMEDEIIFKVMSGSKEIGSTAISVRYDLYHQLYHQIYNQYFLN